MKYLSVSMIFIGTLMGAGFVSGRECAVFFTGSGFLGAVTAGTVSGLGAFAFMLLGPSPEKKLFPGRSYIPETVIKIQSALFLTATFALGETLAEQLFSLPGGGIVTAVAAFPLSRAGDKIYKRVTSLFVPATVTIALLIALGIDSDWVFEAETFGILPVGYAAMNILIPAVTASKYSKNLNTKEKFLTSALIAVLTTAVIYIYINCIRGAEQSLMPAPLNAPNAFTETALLIMLGTGSVTSAAAAIKTGAKNSVEATALTLAALTAAGFGFGFITEYLYPVMSYIALTVLVIAVLRAAIKLKSPCKKECDLI